MLKIVCLEIFVAITHERPSSNSRRPCLCLILALLIFNEGKVGLAEVCDDNGQRRESLPQEQLPKDVQRVWLAAGERAASVEVNNIELLGNDLEELMKTAMIQFQR